MNFSLGEPFAQLFSTEWANPSFSAFLPVIRAAREGEQVGYLKLKIKLDYIFKPNEKCASIRFFSISEKFFFEILNNTNTILGPLEYRFVLILVGNV